MLLHAFWVPCSHHVSRPAQQNCSHVWMLPGSRNDKSGQQRFDRKKRNHCNRRRGALRSQGCVKGASRVLGVRKGHAFSSWKDFARVTVRSAEVAMKLLPQRMSKPATSVSSLPPLPHAIAPSRASPSAAAWSFFRSTISRLKYGSGWDTLDKFNCNRNLS